MSSNVNRLLISLLAALSLPALSQTTALTNINVIDVTSMSINKNQTIVIDGDRIKKVISANKVKLDKDAVIVDMAGKYAMPGLIDTHVHHATDPDGWDNDQITRKRLQGLLRGGVTSVRDMGGDNRALASLKEELK